MWVLKNKDKKIPGRGLLLCRGKKKLLLVGIEVIISALSTTLLKLFVLPGILLAIKSLRSSNDEKLRIVLPLGPPGSLDFFGGRLLLADFFELTVRTIRKPVIGHISRDFNRDFRLLLFPRLGDALNTPTLFLNVFYMSGTHFMSVQILADSFHKLIPLRNFRPQIGKKRNILFSHFIGLLFLSNEHDIYQKMIIYQLK